MDWQGYGNCTKGCWNERDERPQSLTFQTEWRHSAVQTAPRPHHNDVKSKTADTMPIYGFCTHTVFRYSVHPLWQTTVPQAGLMAAMRDGNAVLVWKNKSAVRHCTEKSFESFSGKAFSNNYE
jgi:hypothetical protein